MSIGDSVGRLVPFKVELKHPRSVSRRAPVFRILFRREKQPAVRLIPLSISEFLAVTPPKTKRQPALKPAPARAAVVRLDCADSIRLLGDRRSIAAKPAKQRSSLTATSKRTPLPAASANAARPAPSATSVTPGRAVGATRAADASSYTRLSVSKLAAALRASDAKKKAAALLKKLNTPDRPKSYTSRPSASDYHTDVYPLLSSHPRFHLRPN
jgi:hypothetical protein